jgi:hypothetical protein
MTVIATMIMIVKKSITTMIEVMVPTINTIMLIMTKTKLSIIRVICLVEISITDVDRNMLFAYTHYKTLVATYKATT